VSGYKPDISEVVIVPKHESGPREGVEGVVEDAKGKIKEAAGIVTGKQDKAKARRDAARQEAAAEKARAEADLDAMRQRGYQ
jgi:uncharacterized protein YjbJ (UPF0337 family)